MKKILSLIVVALVLLQAGAAFANEGAELPAIRVFVHGIEVDFNKYDGVMPKIENGRTLVPIRAITDALNAQIAWDEITRTVTITSGENAIVLVIGSHSVSVNGVSMETEAAPVIENGRTLVPLRIISEALKEKVEWNGESRAVIIEKAEVGTESFDVEDFEDRTLEEIMIEESNKAYEDEPTPEELEMGIVEEEAPLE